MDQDNFVDEVLMEEGGVEVRTALKQKAEDVAVGEIGQNSGKAETSVVLWDPVDLYVELAESGGF
jgi:hypothetical protein